MKNVKVAAIVVTVIAMVYVIVLALANDVPVQTKVVFLLSDGYSSATELPFRVSFWWNLLWFPIYLAGIVYIIFKRKITGEEPRNGLSNKLIDEKHSVRVITFIMNSLWIVASIWLNFVGMITGFFFQSAADTVGPLSSVFISINLYLVCHVCLGPMVEFMIMLFDGDEPFIEEYEAKFLAFTKSGSIKSLPYLITITLAFALRYVIIGAISYILSFRVEVKKEKGFLW